MAISVCSSSLQIYNSPMAGSGSVVQRLYLSVYNWVVFFGWSDALSAQVLYYSTLALLVNGHETVYDAVEEPLLFAQTAAFVETHTHILATSLILSWSITEVHTSNMCSMFTKVIRYSFFGMKETFGIIPSWHLWLRYSTFLVLYPTGLVSELGLIYVALPYMKVTWILENNEGFDDAHFITSSTILFLVIQNFSFRYYYFSVLLSSLYIPGFPYFFRYMLAQRKTVLSKAKTA
nr:unnamed protein product [Digitaria exilis]